MQMDKCDDGIPREEGRYHGAIFSSHRPPLKERPGTGPAPSPTGTWGLVFDSPEQRRRASTAEGSHGCSAPAALTGRNVIHRSFAHSNVPAACLPLWVDSPRCCLASGKEWKFGGLRSIIGDKAVQNVQMGNHHLLHVSLCQATPMVSGSPVLDYGKSFISECSEPSSQIGVSTEPQGQRGESEEEA